MKISNTKHFVVSISQITAVASVLLSVLLTMSGCDILGFLLTSGPYEKKVIPSYDLTEHQERKVMVWIECPRSANADFDLNEKLVSTFQLYLTQRVGLEPENIVPVPDIEGSALLLDPKKIARSQGAGYLLLVRIDNYEADYLQVRDYYAGELVTRAILFDADSGEVLWPSQPEGKMIHIAVEMETKGRDALVARLTSATVHCILRNLYPCEKLKYKSADERISLQEAYEMETY